jgi:uncharacterized protein (TIGR03067 family)
MKATTFAALLVVAAGASVRADDKALQELEGTYKAVVLKKDGKEMPADVVSGFTARFKEDEVNFTVKKKEGGEEKVTMHPAKIKVDATKKPATIDIAPLDGPEKGRTFLGIYKIENGELWLVFAEKGDRPSDFQGEGEVLFVRLQREKKE